jgi:hypothetical protein
MRAVRVVAAVAATAVSALVMGCGHGTDAGTPAAASSTTAAAPEDITTSPAAVAAGLRQIATIAAQTAAAGTDAAKATGLAGQIEPAWKPIEGTVKANDKNAYLAFEDSFALLETGAEAGDTAKLRQGLAGVSKATADYLARYPG